MRKNTASYPNAIMDENPAYLEVFNPKRIIYLSVFSYDINTNLVLLKNIKGIDSLFNFYQPSCKILLLNEQRQLVEEEFQFKNIEDFDTSSLIENNSLLSQMHNRVLNRESDTVYLEQLLLQNLKTIRKIITPLERTYQGMALFAMNTNYNLENISFLNIAAFLHQDIIVEISKVFNIDLPKISSDFKFSSEYISSILSSITETLENLHPLDNILDAFSKSLVKHPKIIKLLDDIKNDYTNGCFYSILFIPGFLYSGKIIKSIDRLCQKTRLLLITDYKKIEGTENLLKSLKSSNLTEIINRPKQEENLFSLSHSIMCANWIYLKRSGLEKNEKLAIPSSIIKVASLSNSSKQVFFHQDPIRTISIPKVFGDYCHSLTKDVVHQINKEYRMILLVRESYESRFYEKETLFNGEGNVFQYYPNIMILNWIENSLSLICLAVFQNTRTSIESTFSKIRLQQLKEKINKFLFFCVRTSLIERFWFLRLIVSSDNLEELTISIELQLLGVFEKVQIEARINYNNSNLLPDFRRVIN